MQVATFTTSRYRFEVELGDTVGTVFLTDLYSGVAFSDSPYRYSACVERDGIITRLEGLSVVSIAEQDWRRGGKIFTIEGLLGVSATAPRAAVKHHFYISENADFLEERIVLQNADTMSILFRGYRFGFRKRLARPAQYGGPGIDIENYRLVAVPFRLQPDGKKHDYQLDDIYHSRYECSVSSANGEVVDQGRGRSEAWAWTDGEYGLLIAKYNPYAVEYSMIETEHAEHGIYLTFGGASPALYGEPVEARQLEPGAEMVFGKTRLHFYEGLWRRGSYIFREYLGSLGHSLPENYDPPVYWNVHYDIRHRPNHFQEPAADLNCAAVFEQARKARDLGCQALCLDSGWEVCEGSTRWDEERLGEIGEFVKTLKEDYGLECGVRIIGRSYCDDYRGMYRRDADGSVGYSAPYGARPFYEPCVCARTYREEKLSRIIKLVDAGVNFLVFDEFDWRGPCFDQNHDHPIPTTPNVHIRAVADLVRRVHDRHPGVLVEMHDPVWSWNVRYMPIYYLHGQEGGFDETWAFGFASHPLDDLLSGRALSLFYYNLAYEIPLCFHVDMSQDNDNCLAFWWYASTVRHIGVVGRKVSQERFESYKRALAQYLELKDIYARGAFYGPDELTHIHVLPESGRGVLNAFNLTETLISRKVELRLNDLGLMDDVEIEGAPYEMVRGRLVLSLEIPPFSPALVKLLCRKPVAADS